MLRDRKRASDLEAFDAGYEAGYHVGYYQRMTPPTLLPENVPERFENPDRRPSFVDGWQEGYFKGSRAREINR